MKWKKYFQANLECSPNAIVRVSRDWVSYKDHGFNPAVHTDYLKELKDDVAVLEEAVRKWSDEFKK